MTTGYKLPYACRPQKRLVVLIGLLILFALLIRASIRSSFQNMHEQNMLAAIENRMGSDDFSVISLGSLTDFAWNRVAVDHGLYLSIFFDFQGAEPDIFMGLCGNTHELTVSTQYLWIGEDYAPKSPAGRVWKPNDEFVFYKFFAEDGVQRIFMETLDAHEAELLFRLSTVQKTGSRIQAADLVPFQWDTLTIKTVGHFTEFLFTKDQLVTKIGFGAWLFSMHPIRQANLTPESSITVDRDQRSIFLVSINERD